MSKLHKAKKCSKPLFFSLNCKDTTFFFTKLKNCKFSLFFLLFFFFVLFICNIYFLFNPTNLVGIVFRTIKTVKNTTY
jgi:hypothetical protein